MKIAVVTGAAGGMGRAIAQKLIADQVKVYGIDKDQSGLNNTRQDLGETFVPLSLDLTGSAQIQQAFNDIASKEAGLDILVNNAGTCLMSEFPNIPEDEIKRQMEVNFFSAFYCCQAAIPLMLQRSGIKKIVNISSNGAYNFDVFDPPHYRASKAALDNLTKDLARRYATDKIAVNSIAPAMTQTPLFNVLTEDVLAHAISKMPHGKAMQPEQIASWVAFLASDAGDVASGNVIILNQGRDVR